MPHANIIIETSEDEIWNVITNQLTTKGDSVDYSAQFATGSYCVTLDIDINPKGDEDDEGPTTSFSAPLPTETDFRFKIEKQRLKHEIGKLFGMQDVVIGHPEFDKKFLIQSNDVAKVKQVLLDDEISSVLLQHPVDTFETRERKIGVTKEIILRLNLEGGIVESVALKNIFQPFKIVLNKVNFINKKEGN
jgi:hypothetical protein